MPALNPCTVASRWFCLLAVMGVIAAIGLPPTVSGKESPVSPGGLTLRQTLEKGLKARRPSEFAFIARVTRKVDDGILPQKMVERTFLWARKHHQPFPMPYFEQALQIQADKLNIDLAPHP